MASSGVMACISRLLPNNISRYVSGVDRITLYKSLHYGRLFDQSLVRKQAVTSRVLHTTSPRSDLMEFFDSKDNWAAKHVRVGRPWKMDELRQKSNEDLHKLWYVLLKERNMIMTMEEEYKRQGELFPNPERLEKVEDSMENLLDVVAERDEAFSKLETGESSDPGWRWAYNELGIGYWRRCKPHVVPLFMNTHFRSSTALSGPWQHHYIRLRREKNMQERKRRLRQVLGKHKAYSEKFPHTQLDTDISEFAESMLSKMKKHTEEEQ